MRKFATKIVSRQNSVDQYFGIQIHILGVLFGILGVLFGILSILVGVLSFCLAYLVFVWCTWCLVYVVFCLATLCILRHNWCLCHWDVVFLTFRIWDGLSNISITKNVQIFIL